MRKILIFMMLLMSCVCAMAQADVLLYKKGKTAHTAKDYQTAFKYFEQAANQGHVDAMYDMGNYYQYGNGIEADNGKAMYWYQKAADNGNKYALRELASVYEYGRLGQQMDYAKAVKYYKHLYSDATSDREKARYAHRIGLCYLIPLDKKFPKNLSEAKKWYKKMLNLATLKQLTY